MNKFYRFTAAAAALAIAASATGCSAPKAVTLGKGTQTALTISGYEVPAGVFIYNEIYAYNNAAYTLYSQNGEYPELEDIKKSKIDDLDAADWIQNNAVDFCKDFVATELEFDKIGEELTQEQLDEIDERTMMNEGNEMFSKNGVGSASIRAMVANSYKQEALFKHYYGLDAEKGCSEDDLKEYFKDKTARIKYFSVSLTDSEGNEYDADTKQEITKLVDSYVKEINSAKTNELKLAKLTECEDKYNEWSEKKAAEAAAKAAEEAGETTTTTVTTTTTTATTSAGETTTTTTTDPYAGEVTLVKYTTTTADKDAEPVETTTAAAGTPDYNKIQQDYSDFVFGKMENYKAEKYQYDESTIYVIIKADIAERMTEEDFWSEENVDNVLYDRYYQDFTDMMKATAESLGVEKNNSAFRKFAPFKLDLAEAK